MRVITTVNKNRRVCGDGPTWNCQRECVGQQVVPWAQRECPILFLSYSGLSQSTDREVFCIVLNHRVEVVSHRNTQRSIIQHTLGLIWYYAVFKILGYVWIPRVLTMVHKTGRSTYLNKLRWHKSPIKLIARLKIMSFSGLTYTNQHSRPRLHHQYVEALTDRAKREKDYGEDAAEVN